MYIYNVTTNVEDSIHLQWLNWMKEKHIPDMLATGKFISAKMVKVLINEDLGGTTYSVQYSTESLQTLQNYFDEDATRLRNEALALFEGKFVAFRTELQVITEQFAMSVKN